MGKKLFMVLAAVVIAAFCVPAFAAVENVKVGGDITAWGVYRNDFDFVKNTAMAINARDNQHYFMTSTRIYVNATLADNITAMVRLINERDWSPANAAGTVANNRAIDLDLAYVKIADMLTPGLSLTVGRQEIQIGEGFIIGSRYNALNYGTASAGIVGGDLGLQKAFDAVKVDYAIAAVPVSISGFMAKINEVYGGNNGATSNAAGTGVAPSRGGGDIDLYALSVLWKPEYFSLEPYYVLITRGFANKPEATIAAGATKGDRYNISTFGLRATGTIPAVKGLSLKGEYAKQSGKIDRGATDTTGGTVEGWAGYLGAGYEFPVSIKPSINAGYSIYSGASPRGAGPTLAANPGDDKVKQFVPIFPSDIADRVGAVAYPAITNTFGILPQSNLTVIKLGVGLQPLQKLSLGLTWFDLATVEPIAVDSSKALGNEIDFNATYAYTEDLSFGFDYGVMLVGKAIKEYAEGQTGTTGDNANPWQAIVSMKLAF